MGWQDRIGQVLNGAADIASAPVGFIIDLARVPLDEEIGLGDPFGQGFAQVSEGLEDIFVGSRLAEVSGFVKEATPIDDVIGEIFTQGELIYSNEMQTSLDRVPLGLPGLDPGDLSISRVGGAVLGGIAALAPGGEAATLNVSNLYKRTEFNSPGQITIGNLFGLWDMPDRERKEIMGGIAFGFTTGVIDAALRWWTQPEIIAGKAVKVARARYTPDSERMLRLFQKSYGMDAAIPDWDGASSAFTMRITGSRGKSLYTVVRRSELSDPTRDRALYLMADEDEALRYASNLYAKNADDVPVLLELDPEDLPVVLDDFSSPSFDVDGFPDNANLITVTDSIGGKVKNARPLGEVDLNYAKYLDDVPDHLKPANQLNDTLYTPDGQAIEPRDLYHLNDLHTDVMGLKEAFNVAGESGATKYIQALRAQKNGGTDLANHMLQDKRIQRALNDMDGKSADYIRRVYFNQVPGGMVIADIMSTSPSYAERRTVLMAAMGLGSQIPEAVTLPPQNMARLRALTRDLDDLAQGPEVYAQRQMVYQSMMSDTKLAAPDYDALKLAVQDEIDQVYKQDELIKWYDAMAKKSVIDTPIRYSRFVHTRENIRSSTWYQNSTLARPLRSINQHRPHPWVNVHDTNADVHIVRQMEEAHSLLGETYISKDRAAHWRGKWAATTTEQEKVAIAHQMDNEIIEAAARKAGLSKDEIQEALLRARRGRATAGEILSSRRYSADADADLVTWVDPDTGEQIQMAMPILGTQLQNWIPLTDVKALHNVSNRLSKFTASGTRNLAVELLEDFYSIWKPAVLLRGGWPIRVVADEQLRILAKTGSLIHHLAAIETGEIPTALATFSPGLNIGQRAATLFGAPISVGTHVSVRAASGVTRGARRLRLIDPQFYDDAVEAGTEKLASARSAYNGPNTALNQEFELMLGRTEAGMFDHLVSKSTGQWTTVSKGDRFYSNSWTRALQDQIGRDPLARVMLDASLVDDTIDAVKAKGRKWLDTSEGREYASRLPWRENNLDRWIDEVDELIDYYTVGYDLDLVNGALSNKVTDKLLSSVDEAMRPQTIHAEIIDQTLGTSVYQKFLRETLSTTFDIFGRLPTDTLSRQPFFRNMYATEMRRQRKLLLAQGVDVLDETVVASMAQQSRAFALQQVNEYLYNLAEASRFADSFKFLTPFFNAWEEVLTVWGKIAIQDPSVIGRAKLLWQAPDKAGLTVRDDEGTEFLQFQLSEKMSDQLELTGWLKYLAEGGVRFGKTTFNLILNNPLPGFGPTVQYPVNELVKSRPELEEAMSFILPYGVQANSLDLLLSPTFKRIRAWYGGPEADKSYESHFTNIATWMDYEYRAGLRTDPPTLDEVHSAAKKIFMIQTFANFTSPAQPLFDSPLKPYIDIYRDLQENYAGDADEIFINQFGSEFISLTLSRTVSTTGIPPTLSAQQARVPVEELISKYPEFGRLIIGEDAATGEFSTAAFAWQLSHPPTDSPEFRDEAERRYRILTLDPDTGTIEEADKRLGWTEYIKAMDMIEVEMKSRGLPSLRVKDAEPLAALKRQFTETISKKYPAWWRDFNQRDGLKWDTRIKTLRDISKSPVMDDRGDMQGIRQYLEARGLLKAELNRRKQLGGSATLSARSNQDLAILWDSMIYGILNDNVAFSPIYYRYLEGDPVG